MEALHELVPLALRTSVFLIVFAIGLDVSFRDTSYLFRRPGLLLRSITAIDIIVPAFAALMVALLPLHPFVKTGIVLMAVSPFAPILPGKELKTGGRKSYVYDLLFVISTLSIVIVPVTVALLGAAFGEKASIAPGAVAKLILTSVILPLAAGMIVRRIWPARSKRAKPVISTVASIVLAVAVLPVLFAVWHSVVALIGDGTVLAILAVVAVGFLAGHLLGGPDPRDRAVLAISSASRHPGIALLIAGANFREPRVKAVILLFLVVGLIATVFYQVWCKRRYPELRQPAPDNAES